MGLGQVSAWTIAHALRRLHQQPGQRHPHGSPKHFQKHVYAPFVVERFKATNEIGEGPGPDPIS